MVGGGPGAGAGDGGAERWGGAGGAYVRQVVHDALWRPPAELPRYLPVAPREEARPVAGGVCAGLAARRGRSTRRVRVLFVVTVLPLLLYPLLWLVRLAGRPEARGREQANRQLFLVVVAAGAALASAAQIANSGVSGAAVPLMGLALGAPLLGLGRSPLFVWRLMTAAALVLPLLPHEVFRGPVHPLPAHALVAYLLVLFLVATQYERPVVLGVGAATTLLTTYLAVMWQWAVGGLVVAAVVLLAPLVLGGNLRLRREASGAIAPRPRLPGGHDVSDRRDPIPVLDGALDAVWRLPSRRPEGPVRLLNGPRRPTGGRMVAGVCLALAGSRGRARVLRVLFVVFAPTVVIGLLAYLVLWLLLPDEREPHPGEEEREDGTSTAPPLVRREITAWAVLAAVSVGLCALVSVQLAPDVGVGPALLLGAALGLPFALLPYAPLLTWRVMVAGLVVTLVVWGSSGVPLMWPWPVAALLALPVVLYAVATAYPEWTTVGVGSVTVVFGLFAAVLLTGTPFAQVAWIAALAVGVLLFGHNVRRRRAAQRELAQESALRRQDRARQAVLQERSRIARELHDVVSHHMSMIAIQAEAAPYKYPELSEGATGTFHTIRDAARDALSEMRRVVGLLREEGEGPERAPQPGLDRLEELVSGACQAGMDVWLEWDGAGGATDDASGPAVPELPVAVDVSAYRIVQEALSNAGRYAPGAWVRVTVTTTSGLLTVSVVNGSRQTSDAATAGGLADFDSGGHGLVGMRERAAMLGGTLSTGPLPDGGYRVHAELPIPDERG